MIEQRRLNDLAELARRVVTEAPAGRAPVVWVPSAAELVLEVLVENEVLKERLDIELSPSMVLPMVERLFACGAELLEAVVAEEGDGPDGLLTQAQLLVSAVARERKVSLS